VYVYLYLFFFARFGSVLAMHGDMLVTASPNARYRHGEVYVYRKPSGAATTHVYVLDQVRTMCRVRSARTMGARISVGHSFYSL
jgi:hypothetical protein